MAKKKFLFMQGDSYSLPVILKDEEGLIDIGLIEEVEFMFDGIRKLYPNEVTYDRKTGQFMVPFTQEETFSMQDPMYYQARIKFVDQQVAGTEPQFGDVEESLSKAVL